MAKHIQRTSLTATWSINASDDQWILAKDALITTDASSAIYVGAEFTGNSIDIRGDIEVLGAVDDVIGIAADATTLVVKSTSAIAALDANIGVSIEARNVRVYNSGIIQCGLTAISAEESATMLNHGTISADTGIEALAGGLFLNNYEGGTIRGDHTAIRIQSGQDWSTILNVGKIVGDVNAIHAIGWWVRVQNWEAGSITSNGTAINADSGHIINSGLIKAPVAIQGGADTLEVENRGTIDGDVYLGAGHDTFDTIGGLLKGAVYGGEGDDWYSVSSRSVKIVEYEHEGDDAISSSINYTLGDGNIEFLGLSGSKNLKATGNDDDNILQDNEGHNVLRGMGGDDVLRADLGNDKLWGGAGADTFVLTEINHDTIGDFQDGIDTIRLSMNRGDIERLIENHSTQTSAGVVLDFFKKTVLIKGVDLADISIVDFGYST